MHLQRSERGAEVLSGQILARGMKSERRLAWREFVRLATDSFTTDRSGFILTALACVIGTASLILVFTIALAGKKYVLGRIDALGTNLIYASYDRASADFLTEEDLHAVERGVPTITAASPLVQLNIATTAGSRSEDTVILGVYPQYSKIRNLLFSFGRPFDEDEMSHHAKVALVTETFARRHFGTSSMAAGAIIHIAEIPFTIVGVFREGVETFGQSEIAKDTILLPYTVARYFNRTEPIKELFFTVSSASSVASASNEISQVLHSRHLPHSVYRVDNLSQLISVARHSADALTLVLSMTALVMLAIAGIGIMNIMLARIRARIPEIGLRKAAGATKRDIQMQFICEAIGIALTGGLAGGIIAMLIPATLNLFAGFKLPVSFYSVLLGISAAGLVGIASGVFPAVRAANMNPIDAVFHE